MSEETLGDVDLVIVAGNARSLIANRGDLIAEMTRRGIKVGALVPRADYLPEVRDLGIPIQQINLARTGMNPIRDFRSMLEIKRALRATNPDRVFSYTIKPIVYGTLAAWLAGVKRRYAMVTGLGFAYTTASARTKVVRFLTDRLYRTALGLCEKVFFQNPDDIAEMVDRGVLRDRTKAVLVNGSGVNLERFPREPLPNGETVFLFIGRLLGEKGIGEFVRAATALHKTWPNARFVAVGGHDPSLPHAVSIEEIDHWKSSSPVEFVGHVKDVRSWLAQCSVFVLPSYREGTPRSVLEAMATGRAIVTSDAPGCRETVEDEINGFLVPPKDADSLTTAMQRYLVEPELITEHADQSYRIVEAKYEVSKVNRSVLEVMGIV